MEFSGTMAKKKAKTESVAAETKKKATKKKKAEVKKEAKKEAAPKKKATRKSRAKKEAIPDRFRLFWGVFNHAMKRVALFEFNQKKAAEKRAEELSQGDKPPHFVQRVKEVIDPSQLVESET
jgi:hypothetical protein